MSRIVPVVDLFSGPGGLAEGFAGLRGPGGRRRFRIALSAESERSAHRTLRLRAFLRQFKEFPPEYYDFLNWHGIEEPDWETLHPKQWAAACAETPRLELGTPKADKFLRERIETIRKQHGGRTVLLGGPPCQPYSVIGRARNAGNAGYNPRKDTRLSLYKQYANVLAQLRPAVAVMENVRGMLSALEDRKPIFPQVMHSLRDAGGTNSYQLFALASPPTTRSRNEAPLPEDFLVHAEEHGVPQARHRVFVICVRHDLAEDLPDGCLPRLERTDGTIALKHVVGAMPRLRSRLSRGDDRDAWRAAVWAACNLVDKHRPWMSKAEAKRFQRALERARITATDERGLPWRGGRGRVGLPKNCPTELRDWIADEKVKRLPNNETRGHMPSDLARYLFAAAFAHAFGYSPKSHEFPHALAPNHANWHTGGFHDRYRVQISGQAGKTVTSHIAKDGHYYIHPDPGQCRSLTVREAARIQTFPDNYFFHGNRSQQYTQVGNAVPPFLAHRIAGALWKVLEHRDRAEARWRRRSPTPPSRKRSFRTRQPTVTAMEAT